MKSYIFVPILVVFIIISYLIFQRLPEHIRNGGPLIIMLMVLSMLTVLFIFERLLTISRAAGRGDAAKFVRDLKKTIDTGKLTDAIEICKKQGGCLANVVGAGLERHIYLTSTDRSLEKDELIDETKRAFEEANALETPLLERNLIALSTIASIATMVGLLGTTIGMIRSFGAMSHSTPDPNLLAKGISEALINTAGGLGIAIVGIIMYNYFTTRVDSFNYTMDETTYEVLQLLQHRKGERV